MSVQIKLDVVVKVFVEVVVVVVVFVVVVEVVVHYFFCRVGTGREGGEGC